MAGLVVLDADLQVIQQGPAVLGGVEEMDPGAVGAAGPAAGLAIYGYCVDALNRARASVLALWAARRVR